MDRFLQRISVILLLCLLAFPIANAQNNKPKKIVSSVVDTEGRPLDRVLVTSNEGKNKKYSSPSGKFIIWAKMNSVILFEKDGYETRAVQVSRLKDGDKIVMEKRPVFSGENDLMELPYGITVTRRSLTGSVSEIDGNSLLTYPDLINGNSLSGKLSGLTVLQQSGEFGRSAPEYYIRGASTLGDNKAIVIVDGLERSMEGLLPEEIETISILKDATSKILYGPRAANGVILVKTKRGERYKRSIDVSVDYGVTLPMSMPEYLNAAQYAELYNEACLNDGLPERYSTKQLDGYVNTSGMNDLRYPDLDYYRYFLKPAGTYRKVAASFTGGNQGARYFVALGYSGGSGLERVGTTTQTDRMSVRGNLDVRITDYMTAYLDVAGRLEFDNMANCSASKFFGSMSTHRPNEYPIFMSGDLIDADLYGEEVLGGSLLHPDNLYASRAYSGYKVDRYFTGQVNLGFDINLDKCVDGLGFKAYVTMDNNSFISKGQTLQSVSYAPVWYDDVYGIERLELLELFERKYQGDVDVISTSNEYNIGFYGNVSYSRNFAGHELSMNALSSYYRKELPGTSQDIVNTNSVLRVAYSYKNKVFADVTTSLMGSGRFNAANRYKVFPAAGLSWVMSEEKWFNLPLVDYLKLKISTGLLGYDASTPFYLYEQRWKNKGDIGFGNPNDETNIGTTGSAYIGNPDLDWEKSFETNVGFDLLMFDGRMNLNADYFNVYRYDIIQQVMSNYQTSAGHMVPYQNWGVVSSQGAELYLSWKDHVGDFSYSASLGVSYAVSKILRDDVITYDSLNKARSVEGAPVDYLYGYISSGLFPKDFNSSDYPVQTMGQYQAGDIRYVDMNGDGIIDDLDMRCIGNKIPRTVLTFDLNLNYKGFGLYLLGTAHLGCSKLLDNSYCWGNTGTGKYSTIALDRWHPENNPSGTFPRLTTTAGTNNFISSDFWIADASFFRLKNVELSYTFTSKNLYSVVNKVKAYLRGTNLLTISGIKDLDPEMPDAGVISYPLMMTMSCGVSLTF